MMVQKVSNFVNKLWGSVEKIRIGMKQTILLTLIQLIYIYLKFT